MRDVVLCSYLMAEDFIIDDRQVSIYYLALGLHTLFSYDNFCHTRFVLKIYDSMCLVSVLCLKFMIVCFAHGSCVFNFDNV